MIITFRPNQIVMTKKKKKKFTRPKKKNNRIISGQAKSPLYNLASRLAEAERYLQEGHFQLAGQICNEVLIADPSQPAALSMLASIAIHSGNSEMALEYCNRVIKSNNRDPNIYILKGLAYYELGKYEASVESYLDAIRLNGSLALAHYNLGNAYKALDNLDSAASAYKTAINLNPVYFKAYNNLGNIYQKHRFYEKAVECFVKAIEINPNVAEIHKNLGVAYEILKETDKAMESYDRALRLQPGYPLALAGMALILEKNREHERAYALLDPIVDRLSKDDAVAATTFALVCGIKGEQARSINILTRLLAEKSVPDDARKQLYFSLGGLYDKLGRYGEAFESFQQGNNLHDEYFIPEQNLDKIKKIIGFYATGEYEISSNQSKLPVFIVGMPRSGTSLVEQIIACHPLVYGAGELKDIHQLAASLPQLLGTYHEYPECEKLLTKGLLNELAGQHLDMLKKMADDESIIRVTDKMPGNYLYLGLIKRLFPKATIIHCMRDPLDTCLSCYFQDFVGYHPYAYNLMHLGMNYRHYEYLMEFWRDVIGLPMLEVRYEDLVANQEAISRELIEHCGLEWDEACLNFHKSSRCVHTANFQQVRKPMYSSSVGRWKNYERCLEPLKKGLETRIK